MNRQSIQGGLIRGLLCLLILVGAQQPTSAQTSTSGSEQTPPADWQVTPTENGVTLAWQPGSLDRSQSQWPLADINGLQLPAQVFTFAATGSTSPRLRIDSLTSQSVDSRESPTIPTTPAIPQTVDGELRSDLAVTRSTALPEGPVTILRQGRMRGVDMVVVAVTQRFAENGLPRTLTSITFSVEDAVALDALPTPATLTTQPFALEDVAAPSPLAARGRARVEVTNEGMQEILLADLKGSGFVTDDVQIDRLQLYRNDQLVALEQTGDRLRFYAPRPGDRWNATDIYWLLIEDHAGLRMASRAALGDGANALPIVDWAWESGRWSAPTFYDSNVAGADQDHWFAANLRSGPGLAPVAMAVPITSVLPALAEHAVLTLHTTGYTNGVHNLRVSTSGPVPASTLLTWSGIGDHDAGFSFDSRSQQILIATEAGEGADGILVDDLVWQRPVALQFGFGSGTFIAGDTPARLRLQQVANVFRLYDISDPSHPVRILTGGQPAGTVLVQSVGQERYLLVTDGSRQKMSSADSGRSAIPRLTLRPPINFAQMLNADAIYIAPTAFHTPMQPLLDHRSSQGYQAALIDLASIYDGWSGGQIAPAAIRDFLRWAAANSTHPPQAATIVGDGTSDPFNYTGRNNTNFVPPYLLPVDPWLGETACDSCFGQLDGVDPLDDPLPDVAVGRIPAKSADEVAFYVTKLLGYEQVPATLFDRARIIFVADNFRDAAGRPDGAGDFARAADSAAAEQPAGTHLDRIYYDPFTTHIQDPWREPDALTARQKTIDAFNRGGGFANYVGHAHHWQLASTDLNADPSYLLGMYDADELTNSGNLPILLEMTCLTGMFQQPAYSGTTIDERLLLHTRGGAAAIWSSSGFGVAHGHDSLQRGFYGQFWDTDSTDRRLGALAQAGYLNLFSESLCCQENLRTFVILGDPLTVPQAAAERQVLLPLVGK